MYTTIITTAVLAYYKCLYACRLANLQQYTVQMEQLPRQVSKGHFPNPVNTNFRRKKVRIETTKRAPLFQLK